MVGRFRGRICFFLAEGLGLGFRILGQGFRIVCFDRQFGLKTSRHDVISELGPKD